MHEWPRWRPAPDARPDDLLKRGETITLADLLSVAKRYSASMLLCLLTGLGAATAYLMLQDPMYTAATKVLIEPLVPQIPVQRMGDLSLQVDSAQVESQLALLRSERITTMVIEELRLQDDPEFSDPPELAWTPSWDALLPDTSFDRHAVDIASLSEAATDSGDEAPRLLVAPDAQAASGEGRSAIAPEGRVATGNAAHSEYRRVRRALDVFHDNYRVWREGISHVIVISFTARDPAKASQIANAIAAAYIRDQLEAKAESQSKSNQWLESRIEEIRDQMNRSTQAVQGFRAGHDYRIGGAPEETTLEELEATAHTYRQMYESFLNAYTASVLRHSYPVPDARVITPASPPLEPSHPRTKLVLALGGLLGMMAAVGTALLRHGLDRSVRTPSDIREQLNVECLGQLPMIKRGWFGRGVYEGLLRSPSSTFAECVRGVKTAISLTDNTRSIRWLAITSTAAGEGKTSLASNLAALHAIEGKRTLVIDADICTAELSRRFGRRRSTRGIFHALQDVKNAREAIQQTSAGFDLLPVGLRGHSPSGAFVHDRMLALLKALNRFYDVVVVDLPPISAAADGLAVSPAFDGVVVVAEWSKTPVDLIGETCRTLRLAKAVLLGVVVSKVVGKMHFGYGQYGRPTRGANQALRVVARRG